VQLVTRGVKLTEAGETLRAVVQRSFHDIEESLHNLEQRENRKEIRLKLTPSLAFKWLLPKLEDFYHQNPDIQVQLFAEGALVDSERKDFDLAIDYGPFPYNRMPWAKAPRDYEWLYWASEMGVEISTLKGHFFKPIPANAGYFLITHNPNETTATFTQWLKGQV